MSKKADAEYSYKGTFESPSKSKPEKATYLHEQRRIEETDKLLEELIGEEGLSVRVKSREG